MAEQREVLKIKCAVTKMPSSTTVGLTLVIIYAQWGLLFDIVNEGVSRHRLPLRRETLERRSQRRIAMQLLNQVSFETKAKRDILFHNLKQCGFKSKRWVLANQERGYSGFGSQRDRTTRDIYMLNIFDDAAYTDEMRSAIKAIPFIQD